MLNRRHLLQGAALLGGSAFIFRPEFAAAQIGGDKQFTPEMFGAKGDGVTNDTAAFAALARAVNLNGGGTISLRKAVYLVGQQVRTAAGDPWSFRPAPILEFRRCRGAIRILGNGGTLRCAPGLRFGTFDRRTGRPTKRPYPNYTDQEVASPYSYMILGEECSGPILIENLELDGGLNRHVIGGGYGDTGWQIPGSGIFLRNNRGDEIIRNVHSHHHAQDGVMIDGVDDAATARRVRRQIENLRVEYNGRQGCSIVGGRGYAFRNCKFNHTGRGAIASAPAAGVDIEAEGNKLNRDFSFVDCEFSNNVGCGLLADSGDSAGATFTNCRFIGTTVWSAWPKKPFFRFDKCIFVGAVVHCYGDEDPRRAAQFYDCYFTDDRALSPTRQVYVPGKRPEPGQIVDVGGTNVLFERCRFRALYDGQLPWSWRALYSNCTMEQKAPQVAYPKGKYLGFSTIKGNVDLYGTQVIGVVVVNGKRYEKVQLGGESW